MTLLPENTDEWLKQYNAQREWFDNNPHAREFTRIDLPYAGAHFTDDTLEEFEARLLMLRGLGYHFPDYVLEGVREEMAEQAEKPQPA